MSYIEQIDKTRIPQHVAIIMDGNGRWAKQRGKERTVTTQARKQCRKSQKTLHGWELSI